MVSAQVKYPYIIISSTKEQRDGVLSNKQSLAFIGYYKVVSLE